MTPVPFGSSTFNSSNCNCIRVFISVAVFAVSAHAETPKLAFSHKRVDLAYIRSAAISRDGSLVAIGTETTLKRPSTVYLCDANDPTKLRSFGKHDERIIAVEFSPKADLLAIANEVQRVVVQRVSDEAEVASIRLDRFNAKVLRFSPKGDLLAMAGSGGSVNIWNTRTWKLENELTLQGQTVNDIVISPAGDTLVAGSGSGQLVRWDIENRKQIGDPLEYSESITSIDYSADGKSLMLSTIRGTVVFYDATTWKALSTHNLRRAVSGCVFTQEGKSIVVTSSPSRVELMERMATGIGEPHSIVPAELRAAVYSLRRASDSDRIIGNTNGNLFIWSKAAASQ